MVVWLRLQRSSSFSRLDADTSLSTSHECGLAATKRASARDTARQPVLQRLGEMHKLDIIVQAWNSRFAGTFFHFVGTNMPVGTLT